MMYPSVNLVGKYLNKDDFYKQKLTSGAWVHYDDLVRKVLIGDYDSIIPLHIEVCVTYNCNFRCSWCSCKEPMSKKNVGKGLSLENLYKVIDECSQNAVGIQWTGGEPLMNHNLLLAIKYATDKNVSQCLFTNGSLISTEEAYMIMQSNLTFVRISLNCVDSTIHSSFHGNISEELSKKVIDGITKLSEIKLKTDSQVKIGISLVVDSTNIDNLLSSIEYLNSVNEKYANAIDFIVIRPINDSIRNVKSNIEDDFHSKYNQVVKDDLIERVRKSGIDVVFPFSYDNLPFEKITCRGCTVFSELSPHGDVFLCSDRYGDKNYIIGNILRQPISQIYSGEKRKQTANRNSDCFSRGLCPQNSRGWYFNSIFAQIEQYRENGEMDIVCQWIEELKEYIPNLGHSFFI